MSTLLVWVLVLHCHHECTFAALAKRMDQDPTIAIISMYPYSTGYSECTSDKASQRGTDADLTCEVRHIGVDGGQITAVVP